MLVLVLVLVVVVVVVVVVAGGGGGGGGGDRGSRCWLRANHVPTRVQACLHSCTEAYRTSSQDSLAVASGPSNSTQLEAQGIARLES